MINTKLKVTILIGLVLCGCGKPPEPKPENKKASPASAKTSDAIDLEVFENPSDQKAYTLHKNYLTALADGDFVDAQKIQNDFNAVISTNAARQDFLAKWFKERTPLRLRIGEICSDCKGTGCPKCFGKQTCSKCGGIGYCLACKGLGGSLEKCTGGSCSGCGGLGLCSGCGGKGFLTCQNCRGSGTVYEKSSVTCPRCKGSRRYTTELTHTDVQCHYCSGTGKISNSREVNCSECRGSGRLYCKACGGQKNCPVCKRSGHWAECSVCFGTGRAFSRCPECRGTKNCPDCSGTKLCGSCKGTGRCASCDDHGIKVVCDLDVDSNKLSIPQHYLIYPMVDIPMNADAQVLQAISRTNQFAVFQIQNYAGFHVQGRHVNLGGLEEGSICLVPPVFYKELAKLVFRKESK